jgi:hypothetical protein
MLYNNIKIRVVLGLELLTARASSPGARSYFEF